jgi:hypothetical protein
MDLLEFSFNIAIEPFAIQNGPDVAVSFFGKATERFVCGERVNGGGAKEGCCKCNARQGKRLFHTRSFVFSQRKNKQKTGKTL